MAFTVPLPAFLLAAVQLPAAIACLHAPLLSAIRLGFLNSACFYLPAWSLLINVLATGPQHLV
jgi:hypothetical protein